MMFFFSFELLSYYRCACLRCFRWYHSVIASILFHPYCKIFWLVLIIKNLAPSYIEIIEFKNWTYSINLYASSFDLVAFLFLWTISFIYFSFIYISCLFKLFSLWLSIFLNFCAWPFFTLEHLYSVSWKS